MHAVAVRLAAGHALQLFFDGGFDGVRGAANFVVVCYVLEDGAWHGFECGYRGFHIASAVSSFGTELMAVEMATAFALELTHDSRTS